MRVVPCVGWLLSPSSVASVVGAGCGRAMGLAGVEVRGGSSLLRPSGVGCRGLVTWRVRLLARRRASDTSSWVWWPSSLMSVVCVVCVRWRPCRLGGVGVASWWFWWASWCPLVVRWRRFSSLSDVVAVVGRPASPAALCCGRSVGGDVAALSSWAVVLSAGDVGRGQLGRQVMR